MKFFLLALGVLLAPVWLVRDLYEHGRRLGIARTVWCSTKATAMTMADVWNGK